MTLSLFLGQSPPRSAVHEDSALQGGAGGMGPFSVTVQLLEWGISLCREEEEREEEEGLTSPPLMRGVSFSTLPRVRLTFSRGSVLGGGLGLHHHGAAEAGTDQRLSGHESQSAAELGRGEQGG